GSIGPLAESGTVRPRLAKHEQHTPRGPRIGTHHGIGDIEDCNAVPSKCLQIGAIEANVSRLQVEVESIREPGIGIEFLDHLAQLSRILLPVETLARPRGLAAGCHHECFINARTDDLVYQISGCSLLLRECARIAYQHNTQV